MKTDSITYKIKRKLNSVFVLCFSLLFSVQFTAFAQTKTANISSVYYNPLFIGLLCIISVLLIVIAVLANVVKAAAHYKREKERGNEKKFDQTSKIVGLAVILTGIANSVSAQTEAVATTAAAQSSYWGLGSFTFYLLISIIAFEIIIAWALYTISMQLLGIEERDRKIAEDKVIAIVKQPSFIEKINASVAIEKEEDIMLDHNYDGIRELDNNLPPWWKYGFYLTIVISIIYMIHFHISNTGKLQLAEYEEQLIQAKHDMEEYSKKASNLVDENNAATLTDNESLTSGKSIFMDNCAACHGKAGQGGVGPNLTDDYWLHKGSIKDIFKTIKYGFPEKGMKSWQQDLGAKQIHEVASYIKSLYGTNPPDPKEKQGELYKEESINDSTIVIKDSVQIVQQEK